MTFEKVREIICNQLGKTEDKVTLESAIIEDLGADSLDVVEMLMALEEEFSMTLPDEACAKLKTVGDIVTFIDSHKK
ncbi:MAG: acyl carrier protein [Christensenellales bacterium]